jgi:meso-butanediol dehydrogenase/(S,S)-butanediol dehydrogenase/diacetyl reductase
VEKAGLEVNYKKTSEFSQGCIVNTASLSGLGADWGMCVYDTSKGAVVNLTRSLALDFGRHGVRVNSVCPTVTLTGMSAGFEKSRKMMAALRERVPLGRPALPADIAAAITHRSSILPAGGFSITPRTSTTHSSCH